jgi:mRNA-degrading endonuclease toxin of MazEF toxin-antitoxin module
MPVDCVVNTDNLHTIPKDRLRQRITLVPEDRLFALTQAIRYSLDLEW